MIKFLQIVAAILAVTTVQVWVDNQNPFFLADIAQLNSNFNFNFNLSSEQLQPLLVSFLSLDYDYNRSKCTPL